MAKQLTLSDGRNLDYIVNGAKDGFPLVWCHGTPSGYTPIPALLKGCEQRGFQLITFSRSGYGGSSRRKGRSIGDDVDDVRALLKHLGHDKCVIGGWSGGGMAMS
jgi:pimeloyl-ACP methyl ester carboxylesterase